MNNTRRIIAMLLVLALTFGIVGCSGQARLGVPSVSTEKAGPQTSAKRRTQTPEKSNETAAEEESSESATLPTEEPEREDLEQILNLVTDGSTLTRDVSRMDDQELTELIGDILEDSAPENAVPQTQPGVSVDTGDEILSDDGTLRAPFDQLYPELMDQVSYSDESLMIKMDLDRQGQISEAMSQAGVAKLEPLFSVDEAGWYEARLTAGTDTVQAIAALRQSGELLVADYNYAAHADSMGQPEVLPENIQGNTNVQDQWYLEYCGIPSGLDSMTVPGGSSNVIVAVIDTGVDYDHADLADNMWVNAAEIPDNGIDDDGNGYTDDYYGVNVITGCGNGDDDNGHGTHVAGIIAARNNNLGTVGIAYNAKIMSIKALNSEGVTDDVSIVNAILYAVENGAEVINMSFGQEAMSLSVQEALAMAYGQCVLVASAGNDGAANEGENAIPNYPAALSYVLGVMSVDQEGSESGFSSYDVTAYNGIEYELYAPGEGILSTIAGDRYASWSGTSMAAPMVSAMAALLRSQYADRSVYSTKFIYGQLTATSEKYAHCGSEGKHGSHSRAPIVDLHAALTQLPQPDVGLSGYDLFDSPGFSLDTAGLNNGDGVVDSGETFALGLTLRNRWGASGSTRVTLSAAESDYITIHNPTVEYGGIGTYSTADCGKIYTGDLLTGWEDPFYITVSEDCPGNYVMRLNVTITSTNGLNTGDDTAYTNTAVIYLAVRNGKVLPTIIDEDMTLKSGNLYIVANATTIEEGITVTAEPGAQIQFWSSDREDPYADQYMPSLRVYGSLLVEGTKDNPVYIFPGQVMDRYGSQSDHYTVNISAERNGVVSLIYADVTNLTDANYYTHITYAYGCTFRCNTDGWLNYRSLSGGNVHSSSTYQRLTNMERMENCVFHKLGGSGNAVDLSGTADGCAFVDSAIRLDSLLSRNCLFLGNTHVESYYMGETDELTVNHTASSFSASNYTFGLSSENVSVIYRPETGTS